MKWGKGTGERKAAGVFIYAKPKDHLHKNHNKGAMLLLENKRSQLILDRQSLGTTYIPSHRFKDNFFDFYGECQTSMYDIALDGNSVVDNFARYWPHRNACDAIIRIKTKTLRYGLVAITFSHCDTSRSLNRKQRV